MKIYNNNKKSYYYCLCRKILILRTPEEDVRQKVLHYLINEMNVPIDSISSEYRLSKTDGNSMKRADIVVWSDGQPLLLLELKASNVVLTEHTLEQAQSYNKILNAKYIGISNGKQFRLYKTSYDELILLSEDLVSYEQLIEGNVKFQRIREMSRLSYELVTYERYVDFIYRSGYIGEETQKKFHPFIAELQNFILKGDLVFQNDYSITILEDLDYGYFNFGNASGGSYPGYYRSFIVKDFLGNDAIYRIGIFGTATVKQDPKYKNRKGNTYINVAIDRSGKSTNLLQLSFDKYSLYNEKECSFYFWHDGRRSRVKSSKIIDLVDDITPALLRDGKIDLGVLPSNKQLTDENASDFIERLLSYATVRNTF